MATVTKVKLSATDGSANDRFGETVAVDGTRMVVGAYYADVNDNQNQGAVYIYEFDGVNWKQTNKLTASDGVTNTRFGYRVSIDGNRLAVLADNVGEGRQKKIYVYELDGVDWNQVAKLTSSDIDNNAYCRFISLSGERLALGCQRTTIDPKGAVYVFEPNSGNIWDETTKITPTGSRYDNFGITVALSGNRLAAGSHGYVSGQAYVFEINNSGLWNQLVKIEQPAGVSAGGFGLSVALQNDRLAVGPYIFEPNSSGTWSETAVVGGGRLPLSSVVTMLGNRLLLGRGVHRGDSGEANLFELRGTNWHHISRFVASDQTVSASFANAVALSETHVIVGGHLATVNDNPNQGVVYLFDYNSTAPHKSWLESQKVVNDGGLSGGRFSLVSMNENRMAVSASNTQINGNEEQGAVYIYDFDGNSWNKTTKLFDNAGTAKNHFGYSISLSGDRLAISSSPTDANSNPAIYLYHFDGTTWNRTQKITFDTDPADYRYAKVSLDGSRMAVGLQSKAVNGNLFQGAVYIYNFDGTQWNFSSTLTATDGAEHELFGYSVSLSGDLVAVGSTGAAINGNPHQGAAYVFSLSNGSWNQTAKLAASDGEAYAWFGGFVSLENNRLVAAARHKKPLKAYVFDHDGTAWTETTKLIVFDTESSDQISSISLSKSRVAIGVSAAKINRNHRQGAVYIYQLKNNHWSFSAKLTASDGESGKQFGESVSLVGSRIAIKSGIMGMVPGSGLVIALDPGSVYIYVDDFIFRDGFN